MERVWIPRTHCFLETVPNFDVQWTPYFFNWAFNYKRKPDASGGNSDGEKDTSEEKSDEGDALSDFRYIQTFF